MFTNRRICGSTFAKAEAGLAPTVNTDLTGKQVSDTYNHAPILTQKGTLN